MVRNCFKEELLVEARGSHKKTVGALETLEKPPPQYVEDKVVSIAHVEKMIKLFSTMGATQQGTYIFAV